MTDPFALDRKALVAVVLVGLLLGPAAILVTVWQLSGGLDFAGMTRFEWIAGALSLLLVALILRAVGRELAGAIGVRFDEQGVQRGSTRLAWDAVCELSSPHYGYLELRDAGGQRLRITTYLFLDRAGLLAWIGAKVGVVPRERTLSL